MRLGDSWRRLEHELPDDWSDARLLLRLKEADQAERAASVLAPLMAGRSGNEIRFHVARHGAGPSTDGARRLLRRLDDEKIRGDLELVSSNRLEPVADQKGDVIERCGVVQARPQGRCVGGGADQRALKTETLPLRQSGEVSNASN